MTYQTSPCRTRHLIKSLAAQNPPWKPSLPDPSIKIDILLVKAAFSPGQRSNLGTFLASSTDWRRPLLQVMRCPELEWAEAFVQLHDQRGWYRIYNDVPWPSNLHLGLFQNGFLNYAAYSEHLTEQDVLVLKDLCPSDYTSCSLSLDDFLRKEDLEQPRLITKMNRRQKRVLMACPRACEHHHDPAPKL